jgi:hypothetical protein
VTAADLSTALGSFIDIVGRCDEASSKSRNLVESLDRSLQGVVSVAGVAGVAGNDESSDDEHAIYRVDEDVSERRRDQPRGSPERSQRTTEKSAISPSQQTGELLNSGNILSHQHNGQVRYVPTGQIYGDGRDIS